MADRSSRLAERFKDIDQPSEKGEDSSDTTPVQRDKKSIYVRCDLLERYDDEYRRLNYELAGIDQYQLTEAMLMVAFEHFDEVENLLQEVVDRD